MGDTFPADDQTESFSVASALDSSEESLAVAKEVELQSAEDDCGGCFKDVRTRESGISSVLRYDDLHNDAEIKEVDCYSVKEPSNEERDGVAIHHEYDSKSSKKVEIGVPEPFEESSEERLPSSNGVVHTEQSKESDMKEHTRIERNLDGEAQKFESVFTKKATLSTCPVSKTWLPSSSRNPSKVMNRVQGKLNSVETQGTNGAVQRSQAARGSVSSGTIRANYTVPQPFALATDKRASIGGRPIDRDASLQSHRPHRFNGTLSAPINVQDPKRTGSKFVMAKPLHSESTKRLGNLLVKNNALSELKEDDDDVQSISSVGSKASRVKVGNASGFLFKSDERAEKRKEFYTKLEERHIAKEEEKNQIQAKTKEELETEIKQLRKSLKFKATPMPTFYCEGVPQKAELKKIPTTRAKSPKFGRRNSFVSLDSQGSNARSRRLNNSELDNSSGSLHKLADENADKLSDKSSSKSLTAPGWGHLSRPTSEKLLSAKAPESTNLSNDDTACPSDSATTSADGSTDKTKVRENCEAANSVPIHLTDKDGVAEPPHENVSVTEHIDDKDGVAECLHKNVNEWDGSMECMETNLVLSENASSVPMAAVPESDPEAESGCADVVLTDGSLKNSNLTGSKTGQKNDADRLKTTSAVLANGTKAKSGRNLRHNLKEEYSDAKANKISNRERLKASTPSFRLRRGSVGTASMKHTSKSDHNVS